MYYLAARTEVVFGSKTDTADRLAAISFANGTSMLSFVSPSSATAKTGHAMLPPYVAGRDAQFPAVGFGAAFAHKLPPTHPDSHPILRASPGCHECGRWEYLSR